MPSTISAGTTAGTAIAVAGDTTGNLAFQTNGTTTAMTIDTSQNVGIGTASPTQKLDVSFSDTTSCFIKVGNSAGSVLYGVNASGNAFVSGQTASKNILFETNNIERMRIDSSGNLLVNTTSGVSNGTINLSFDGASKNGIGLKTTLASNGTDFIVFENSAGSTAGRVTQNGTTTVSYTTSSDYRLKEQITPMTGALAKVSALKPVTYKWKVDGSNGQGFIAHELQEVCPDAVVGEKDAVQTYTDENGNEQTRIKPQGIDTSFLVATLTAAIQELNAKVEAQAAEIAALKGA
jgi:hypothetical protein